MPITPRCLLVIATTVALGAAEVAPPEPLLPVGCDNALVIVDIPSHLVGLLRAEPMRRLLDEGTLGRWLAKMGTDADAMVAKLEDPTVPIPLRLGLGMPRQGWDGLARLLGLGMRVGLLSGADDHPDQAPAIARLRGEALEELRALRVPPLCVSLDFRNPALGSGMAMAFGGFLQQAGFVPERMDGATSYRRRLGELVDEATLRHVALESGLAEEADDELAGDLAAAMAAIELRIGLRQRAAGFQVTIGDWPAAGADAVPPPTAEFVAMRWRVAELRTALAAAQAWWSTWDETPLGRAAKAADSEDLIGDLRRTTARLAGISASGEAIMTLDGEGIAFLARGDEPASQATLASQRLLAVAPVGAALRSCDAEGDVGTWLGELLEQWEQRLANQSFRAIVRDDEARSDAIDAISAEYYRRFAELRSLVLDRHAEHFLPGLVQVVETGGRFDRLEIVRLEPAETGIRASAVPVPALALVCRSHEPGTGLAFFERLAAAAIAPLYDLAGDPPPAAFVGTIATPAGREVAALDTGWIDALAERWRITATGESVLHASEVDGWFVLSTSLALTDRIHASIAAAKPAADLVPDAYVQGTTRGIAFADLLAAYAPLIEDPERLTILGHLIRSDRAYRESLAEMVGGTAEVLSVLGEVTWLGRNAEGGRRFELRVTLAQPRLAPPAEADLVP